MAQLADYETLAARHPGLVFYSINGFDGPYAGLPAYDQLMQGLVGVMPSQGVMDRQPRSTGRSPTRRAP